MNGWASKAKNLWSSERNSLNLFFLFVYLQRKDVRREVESLSPEKYGGVAQSVRAVAC